MKNALIFLCFSISLLFIFAFKCNNSGNNTILMVMADKNFFDPEYTIPKKALEKQGYGIKVANVSGNISIGMGGSKVNADLKISDAKEGDYKSILMVGGVGSADLFDNNDLIKLVQDFNSSDKIIGAQCFTPVILAQADLLKGKKATCWSSQALKLESYGVTYTGEVIETNGNILTAAAGSEQNISQFTEAYISLLKKGMVESKKEEKFENGPLKINDKQTEFEIIHAGNKRNGIMYVPATYNKQKSYSLVFALHGANGKGRDFLYYGFNPIAERLDFIMVYPDGLNGNWDIIPGIKTANDDLGLFIKLIDEFSVKYNIDKSRIYATGHSMGGMMTYRLAYELAGRISAIAPVSGLVQKSPNPIKQDTVSVFHIHAADDEVVNLSGTSIPGSSSFDESINLWIRHNNLKGNPVKTETETGDKQLIWSDKNSGVSVGYYLYSSGGHNWPLGATEMATEFLYNHPARENKIGFNLNDLPYYKSDESPLLIKPFIEKPEQVEKVTLSQGNKIIAENSTPPYTFTFKPKANNYYILLLTAYLKNGKVIPSSNSFNLLVTYPNIAQGIEVLTSGVEDISLKGENAVDGNFRTRWSSPYEDNQFIHLDLKKIQTIKGLTLVWERAYGKDYIIDISKDLTNWEIVHKQKNGTGGIEFISFDPAEARYVRIKDIMRATSWGCSLWELMVY